MGRTLNAILACLLTLIPLAAYAQEETKPSPAPERRAGSRATEQPEKMQQTKMAKTTKIATVLEQTKSPLVSFRLLFMTGSAQDPAGKEGVASLTAALLAEGGSRAMSYDE